MLRAMIVGWGLLALGLFSQGAQADGLFRKVPRVGEWGRYYVEVRIDGEERMDFAVTLRCVKSETIDKAEHLWMEATLGSLNFDEEKRTVTLRFLVPRDGFQAGQNPIKRIVRGYVLISAENSMEFDEAMLNVLHKHDDGALYRALGGKLVDPGTLDRRKILKCQEGNFECRGRRALVKMTSDKSDPPALVIQWETEKAVWGVGAIEVKGKFDDSDIEFSIEYQAGRAKEAGGADAKRS
jgi:hypothetical protein